MATPRTVALHTLGCKLNYSETSLLGRQFEKDGYDIVPFREEADVYVINTCSVTDFADRKCRKAIRDARRANENAFIVVTGCYAQLKPSEIAEIDGVNLVLGAKEKWQMRQYIDEVSHSGMGSIVHCGHIDEHDEFFGSYSVKDRTRTFLKVQDGCDYSCSFCTIPKARGKSRSMPVEKVLTQISFLENTSDVKEIVLTGINLGDYGLMDGKRVTNFIELIRAIDRNTAGMRFRISSIEPNLCHNEVIDHVAASEHFMPHFHMPLQSGSDKLLKKMRRRYLTPVYIDRVQRIKSRMPDACIGVDVIVGFPGESEEDFLQTVDFLEQLDVSYLHVFTYSERAGTPAENYDEAVPMQERRRRNKVLRQLSQKKKERFYQSQIGKKETVLVEHKNQNGCWQGYTRNYVRVEIPEEHCRPNDCLSVVLKANPAGQDLLHADLL